MLRFLQLMYQHYNTHSIDGSILQAFDSALLMYKFYIIYFRINKCLQQITIAEPKSRSHSLPEEKNTMILQP
jgi:hypothetical protein